MLSSLPDKPKARIEMPASRPSFKPTLLVAMCLALAAVAALAGCAPQKQAEQRPPGGTEVTLTYRQGPNGVEFHRHRPKIMVGDSLLWWVANLDTAWIQVERGAFLDTVFVIPARTWVSSGPAQRPDTFAVWTIGRTQIACDSAGVVSKEIGGGGGPGVIVEGGKNRDNMNRNK